MVYQKESYGKSSKKEIKNSQNPDLQQQMKSAHRRISNRYEEEKNPAKLTK